MAKKDLILRATVNPPLTTKGSFLSYAEGDNNIIIIYNELLALSDSPYIDEYDAGTEYDDTINNYAKLDGQAYKWINPTSEAAVTPGTDPTKWIEVYASDLGHKKNKDTKLDEGGGNEVSAEALKPIVDAGASIVREVKITLTAAQLKAGDFDLLPAVPNKFYQVIDVVMDFRLTVGLDNTDEIQIRVRDSDNTLFYLPNVMGVTGIKKIALRKFETDATVPEQYTSNKALTYQIDSSANTTGTGSFVFYIKYCLTAE